MTAPTDWKIFLSDLTFDAREEEAVRDVVHSRWLTMGPRIADFEAAVADLTGVHHAVALSSCTAGLYLALQALDIGPGDEVLLPSLTFVATANVVVNRGATPVFCDIVSPELPLISPGQIARRLSHRTRAVMPVDYAGYPCDYNEIRREIADFLEGEDAGPGQTIAIVEDAAHGIGGALNDRHQLGACGDAGVFSFFSNKNLVTGEGGMLVTDRDDLAESTRRLRAHGLTRSTWERHQGGAEGYDVLEAGWNFRPSELTAALGLVQLDKLASNQQRRADLVAHYWHVLSHIDEVTIPFHHIESWYRPAHHLMTILLPDRATRDAVRDHLTESRIQTSHHYPPIHRFTIYRDRADKTYGSLDATEEFADRELTLPLHPELEPADVDEIADCIKQALGGKKKASR